MKKAIVFLFFLGAVSLPQKNILAHCEVPCGIYHDELRFELINEHIETISKAMRLITELSAEENINYNQVVRWVNTKEEHAVMIQDIANQYFLTQRIKVATPDDAEKYEFYVSSLKYLHEIIVYSMKCKQTTDQGNVEKLQKSADAFKNLYMENHKKSHK